MSIEVYDNKDSSRGKGPRLQSKMDDIKNQLLYFIV